MASNITALTQRFYQYLRVHSKSIYATFDRTRKTLFLSSGKTRRAHSSFPNCFCLPCASHSPRGTSLANVISMAYVSQTQTENDHVDQVSSASSLTFGIKMFVNWPGNLWESLNTSMPTPTSLPGGAPPVFLYVHLT